MVESSLPADCVRQECVRYKEEQSVVQEGGIELWFSCSRQQRLINREEPPLCNMSSQREHAQRYRMIILYLLVK